MEAKNWAADQHPGRPIWKLVLLGTCNYVNKHTGKTSAHPETVAQWCNIHKPQTVSDTQRLLAEKGFLIDTGERIGRNGQTIIWEPAWGKHSHATDTKLTPAPHHTDTKLIPPKVASEIGKVGTEPITDKPITKEPSDNNMLCNSIPEGQQSVEKGSSFLGSKESSISAKQQRTKQFEEYATWCFSKGGEPSEKGFRTWRQSQGDRHKGYVIYGKFYTKKQALEMAQKNPELLDKGLFRSATRINGKITVVHQPKPQSSENGAEAA